MANVQIDNIADEITKALKEYTDDVVAAIDKKADELAKVAVQELKATSPKDTGKYAKGWTKKKEKGVQVIYNKDKPGLTHLLEHGHAKRNGGRVPGQPHIKPAEDKINTEFPKEVKIIIEKGGE